MCTLVSAVISCVCVLVLLTLQALLASAQQGAGRGAQRLARLYRIMEALQSDMRGADLDALADSRTALDMLYRELDVLQASLGQVSLQVSAAGESAAASTALNVW